MAHLDHSTFPYYFMITSSEMLRKRWTLDYIHFFYFFDQSLIDMIYVKSVSLNLEFKNFGTGKCMEMTRDHFKILQDLLYMKNNEYVCRNW